MELEKKYEGRYQELQIYYDNLLKGKVLEAEKIAEEAAEKIQAEENELRKYIEYLEENSTPSDEFSKLAKYCEQLREVLENKISEHDEVVQGMASENEELTAHLN